MDFHNETKNIEVFVLTDIQFGGKLFCFYEE
jgi:hypothetical protein